jgi:hypothetical protein
VEEERQKNMLSINFCDISSLICHKPGMQTILVSDSYAK